MNTSKLIRLTPPHLTNTHISKKISCIRPHRERIFNVSMEQKDSKTIFHNYGHGGAGWTFLFGCVQESIRQFEAFIRQNGNFKNKSICVIGAGCYGLLTAIMLAQRGFTVHIIAKEIDDTPSYKAAGFFFPRWRKSSNEQEKEIFLSRGIESYEIYLRIAQGTHPFIKTGTRMVSAYYGLDIDPGFAPYIQKNLIAPSQQVVVDFGNSKKYRMNEYRIIFMDSITLMRELHINISSLKIPIIQKEITSWSEISEQLIFNCSGWGAKQLTHDPKLLPVQGHLIILQNQPELKYLINMKVVMQTSSGPRDELIYFAPKNEGILGITFLRNQSDARANAHEFDRLLQRSRDFFGS
ncbi:MAG: hypothetical protein AMXMBFR12_08900 [Candidatus Babeliales bacterium]